MGLRTHITISKRSEMTLHNKKINMKFPLYINYLNYYCIGKVYFDFIPLEDEFDNIRDEIYVTNEGSGELKISTFLNFIDLLEKTKKNAEKYKNDDLIRWYEKDFENEKKILNALLDENLVDYEDYIKFEIW